MTELNWLLQHGAGIAVLITFIGSAFVFIKGHTYKGAISALKEVVEALEMKSKLQDEQIQELTTKKDEQSLQIKGLEEQNAVLLSQRPSNEILEGMIQMIEMNHVEVLNMFATIHNETGDKTNG